MTHAPLLHLDAVGAGTPVVAIHGWGPDHRLMSGCLEPVFSRRPGYRRLYPDLPGFGASSAEGINSTLDVVDAVADLIVTETAGAPFLLVGESYGGYVARELARRFGRQVLGLALIAPIGSAVLHHDRDLPAPRVIARDEGFLATLDPIVRADFEACAVVATASTFGRFERDVAPGLEAMDGVSAARIQHGWVLPEPPERGEPFHAPTLMLTGRQDAVVGYRDQWALLEHYPRATFAVLDRAGHNLQFEQPALFEALIGDWLDRALEAAGSS